MRSLSALTAILAIAILLTNAAIAEPGDDRSTRNKWAKQAPPPKKDEPKYKPWGKVLKDAEKHEGVFNVYTNREDVYFEIREDQLDKPMVNFMNISQGIGTGYVLGGMPIGILETVMFDFHRVEDHIQVRKLNPQFSGGDDGALKNAVALSYGNSILATLKIESEKDASVLVKVNTLFLSDMSDISEWLRWDLQQPVRLDRSKRAFGSIHTFPENVEVEVKLTYLPTNRRSLYVPQVPDERYIEVGVNYSIQMLPEDPMKPRLADDRLGYYMTLHKDFSKDSNESFFVYHINRWRLEKQDPSASISEPIEPIVYYIDTTVPKEYRRYVKRGVEMWQRAFEEAGFANAIIAKDAEDVPDYNALDARFSTIRWIVSDVPSFGAIGPHRTDPRTGEILESDILMEQNMIAGYRRGYRRYAGPEPFFKSDPMLMFLKDPAQHPEVAAYMEMQKRLGFACDMLYGFVSGFELMELAFLMDGTGMDVPRDYVGAAIARVTAHEVGHGLGLRHNFKSSTAVPYESLNDRRVIEDIGMTGSVMDYATPNISRDRNHQGHYWSPTVGTYDRWVIKWGYSEIEGDNPPEQELRMLDRVASQANMKRHTYGTDEDTYPAGALDPDCMIWDLSDDPLAWAEERIGVCTDILTSDKLVDRVVADGDGFVPLRNAVQTLLIQEYFAGSRAVRYIGGQSTARPHRGDNSGQLPLEPVPAAKQREAMGFLAKYIFDVDALAVSPEILNLLQDQKMRDWHNNPYTFGRRFDFPLNGWVAAIQNATLFQLLQPMRLQRMVDTEYKETDPYRISELFAALSKEIWFDNMVPSGRTAVMQRNLQRLYIDHLIRMVVAPGSPAVGMPPEATSLARLQLSRVNARIGAAYEQKGLSDEANAHLLESKGRIDRALSAEMQSSF
jgi:hypothetical protein